MGLRDQDPEPPGDHLDPPSSYISHSGLDTPKPYDSNDNDDHARNDKLGFGLCGGHELKRCAHDAAPVQGCWCGVCGSVCGWVLILSLIAGIILAVVSGLLIGCSFVFKKVSSSGRKLEVC